MHFLQHTKNKEGNITFVEPTKKKDNAIYPIFIVTYGMIKSMKKINLRF